ncbi:spr1629 family repressor/antitoxin [Secundilactobacillus yichangensis]|uniref:spr1629 family repressor/antitoxin n=1 Tax=Secundilactobacillus yichangensis TaxID=2799580 RepID=UPI0022A68C98|nr:XRE family transcriptional regulator [Secundilactobacillus yichangensis]
MFFGEKLADLRELNGMSRKNLADRLSVSEQAIWQYEKKDIIPKIEVLNQIRNLFNVESKYFFEKGELIRSADESQVAYRPKDRDSRKKTRLELRFLDFQIYYLDTFEQTLKLPQTTISDLQKRVQKYIQKNSEISRSQLIETVAKGSRKILKVTNNRDLMYLLERSGIYIVEKDLGAAIDAYSASTSERTFIVLGSVKKSAVRRNFDLAHELGHILLHNDIDMAILDKSEVDKLEDEANNFAGVFLLPQEEFTQDFQQLARKSNPDFYMI